MSASREKKARQELHASGYVDPKATKAEEARKAAKRSNTKYSIIAAAFVLVAAFVIVWNSGLIQKSATAVTVEGEDYSVAEMGYFYQTSYNAWYNQMGAYASYFGLDANAPLSSQMYDEESGMTWADYFAEQGVEQLKWTVAAYNEAQENGYEWSEADEATWTSLKSSLEGYAKANGQSYKNILRYNYGKYITPALFEELTRMSITAESYALSINDGFSFTESEISKYYEENAKNFDVADYEAVTVSGVPSGKDEEGNDIEVTDEMKAEAMAAAKETAESILAAYEAGTDLETASKDLEGVSYNNREDMTYSETDILKWVFDDARNAGDTTVLESSTDYTVLLFHGRERHEYNTVDVRHILLRVDTTGLNSEDDSYESEVEALKLTTENEAKDLLKQWESGDKTEDSFAALAGEHSDDSTSKGNGGLYTRIAKNEMVPGFNEWIFAEGRKAGDTGVVYDENTGYHVMYFVGENAPAWQVQVDSTLRDKAYGDWSASIVKDMVAEEGTGMKYVKN